MSVVAVVAARDEADVVGLTVDALSVLPDVTRVIVVDDASRDGTAAAAAAAGAEVVRGPGRGKGAALETGVAAASGADAILLADADLGETAGQAARLLGPVLGGDAEMAVGVFPRHSAKAGFGLVKGLARWGIARFGGGFEAEAPLSGQRALSAAAVSAARPFDGGFGTEVTTTVRVLRAGLRVVEVPVEMGHRATGRDLAGFAHRGRQFLHVAGALARLAREPR